MRLDDYLTAHNISGAAFARKLTVSHSLVHGWRHGTKLPSLAMAWRIKEATGGAVTADDWPFDKPDQPPAPNTAEATL